MEQSKTEVSKVTVKETEKTEVGDTGSQLPMLGNDTRHFFSWSTGHTESCGANLREAWKFRVKHRMFGDIVYATCDCMTKMTSNATSHTFVSLQRVNFTTGSLDHLSTEAKSA